MVASSLYVTSSYVPSPVPVIGRDRKSWTASRHALSRIPTPGLRSGSMIVEIR